MPAPGDNFISTLATTLMVKNLSATTGMDYIDIMWLPAKFLPTSYKIEVTCELTLNGMRYKHETYKADPLNTNLCIKDLQPRSMCVYIFFAVYNPASIDDGITNTVYTLHLGEWSFYTDIYPTNIYNCTYGARLTITAMFWQYVSLCI